MKAAVALILLIPTIPIILHLSSGGGFSFAAWHLPSLSTIGCLLASGALGLGLGDLFLLEAFTRIGVSRTLILYGFQPLLLGLAGHFVFQQDFEFQRLIAIFFLIGCLLVFSLERYRETKQWELRGLLFALIGVAMDTGGVVITRLAFDQSPTTHPLEGHAIRCTGALLFYLFLYGLLRLRHPNPSAPVIGLLLHFRRLDPRSRALILFGCFAGTYLSLCLYLTAIQIGHLASLSAISITGPMFAALIESVLAKKRPTPWLIGAFVLFIAGFAILIG